MPYPETRLLSIVLGARGDLRLSCMHLLESVFAHWYLGHRLLPTFGNYAWIYVLVIVVDLVVAVGLLTSGRRFRSYS